MRMETQLLKKDLEQGPDASGGRCQQGQIDECRTDIMLRQNIQMTCMMASQKLCIDTVSQIIGPFFCLPNGSRTHI